PAEFRERAPRLEQTEEGDSIIFEGKRVPFTTLNAMAGKKAEDYTNTGKISDTRPGGWDPAERLNDLDIDGVRAEALCGGAALLHEALRLAAGVRQGVELDAVAHRGVQVAAQPAAIDQLLLQADGQGRRLGDLARRAQRLFLQVSVGDHAVHESPAFRFVR